MSTPLASEIKAMIANEGPMSVARFMGLCLGHPRLGYYMTRDPFGENGDFVTAPEISQIFGELLGAWAYAVWLNMGKPQRFRLIEMGPGRGTLMNDALRVLKRWPDFVANVTVHLVESSPFLSALQQKTLAKTAFMTNWHNQLQDVPDGPAILLANELLDALPVRQFIQTENGWRERVVTLSGQELSFGIGAKPVVDVLVPASLRQAPAGTIVEICPASADVVATLGGRATLHPTVALFIDYGHTHTAAGDTLQAVKRHQQIDPLSEIGEADVTAHVDFEDVQRHARINGLVPSTILTQRDMLFRLGLVERAEMLAKANPDRLNELRAGVERLIEGGNTGMGALFKALVLASPETPVPAFDMVP